MVAPDPTHAVVVLNSPAVVAAGLQGWVAMAGLIVAIGAQNALVLRQGLARRHVGAVVALCIVSDWMLTTLGVMGLGRWLATSPTWLAAMRYGGAAFLIAYGALAARRAWSGATAGLVAQGADRGLAPTLATALALTYLNPHVYLDTVVLMGALGAQHPPAARWAFVAGAGAASAAWFGLLGYGARLASGWLRRPEVWRALDVAIAAVMFWIAAQLLLQPLGGSGV
ncbi:MAG: amino acid transporter [Caldimonas sp.]|uniref:LysE/ArgO family amino acid transporter n=1 Tax=Caldimonas manganoxidans TaxID=196015 RepID=UPI00036CBCA8|nr:LysE/ArgO family amino acid transporter [Caldimonas manganoxidans]GIX24656.1 MAG: amino acid transporter [Caldimonas sp.]